jgi:hypothetical protein
VREIKADSAEAVAFYLMVAIARAEGIDLDKATAGWSKEKILTTYRECLAAVKSGTSGSTPFRQVS